MPNSTTATDRIRECGSRSIQILSGLAKCTLCLHGKLPIQIHLCTACCIWRHNANAVWPLSCIKGNAICMCQILVHTCTYEANCHFQLHRTRSYLPRVENFIQIQLQSVKSTYFIHSFIHLFCIIKKHHKYAYIHNKMEEVQLKMLHTPYK